MMGRETNFRYSDLSSVFKDSNPIRYFKRIFQEGDMTVPEKIKKDKPILSLTTHYLFGVSRPIFEALDKRIVFIEIVRHPLYMIIQQTLNMERLLDNPRDIDIYFESGKTQCPWYSYQWDDLFKKSNPVEKAIYSIDSYSKLVTNFKNQNNELLDSKTITIPFELFVLDPWPFMEKIKNMLNSKISSTTKKILKKQNVPRVKISDGIPLAVYKRCGWEKPVPGFSEKDELAKRREFAVKQGAGVNALNILDNLSDQYEKKYLNRILNLNVTKI